MQVKLIPTDKGDSTGVSLLSVDVLYTVQGGKQTQTLVSLS
jgi:hypothetical protein